MPDPVPEKKIEELTNEELSAAIDKATTTASGAPLPEPPKEYEVKTATGQVYKGKTQDEVIQQLVKAQEHATMTIKQQKDLMEALSRQQPPKPATQDNGFDKAKYYKLLEDDPIQAQEYLDGYRESVKQTRTAAQQFIVLQETGRFLQSVGPYYDDSPENAQLIEGVMQARSLPRTADGMKAAFVDLVSEGKIKLAMPQTEEQPPQRTPPPPALGGAGGSAPEPDIDQQLYAMSDKDFEAFLRKRGVLQ